MDSGCSCLPGALRLNGSAAAAGGSTVRRVKLNFGNVARALNKLIIYCSPVSSVALQRWMLKAQSALDEIEAAHQAIGGARRGRRYATLQVNHAYAMLLSSQFQGFCRDLHSEAVDFLATTMVPPSMGTVVRGLAIQGRKLDQGNPNPGNLGSDFGRIGMQLWPQVIALDGRNAKRQRSLETLTMWRNAIAHQDWTRIGPNLHLKWVQVWRSACGGLAPSFDAAVRDHLHGLVGRTPW